MNLLGEPKPSVSVSKTDEGNYGGVSPVKSGFKGSLKAHHEGIGAK